jgi:hypothetical protein
MHPLEAISQCLQAHGSGVVSVGSQARDHLAERAYGRSTAVSTTSSNRATSGFPSAMIRMCVSGASSTTN